MNSKDTVYHKYTILYKINTLRPEQNLELD